MPVAGPGSVDRRPQIRSRWLPLDFLQARILSSRPRLARLFRRLFLEYLQKAFDADELRLASSLES